MFAVRERRRPIPRVAPAQGIDYECCSRNPAEYGAGLKLAIERGRLWKHESGTYERLTQAGANLLA
jgi:hypothetical protein